MKVSTHLATILALLLAFHMSAASAAGHTDGDSRKAQTADSCDYSGIWFDPLRPGEGYNVFANSSGWIIYFLGFDNWGSNFWITSEFAIPGDLQFGQSISLAMYVMPMLAGGEFAHPMPPSSLELWGTLEVSFDSCVSGVFTLEANNSWDFGSKISYATKLLGSDPNGGN